MFNFSFNPSQRFASILDRMRQGPSVRTNPYGISMGQRMGPAPAEADQQVGQASASAGTSVTVNRARQINNHIQRIRIVIDPDVIRKLANGSLLEEMRIKNRLMSLFSGLHGSFDSDQQHDVIVGPDGSQAINSRSQVNNNPQLVTISYRELDGSPELQAANPVISLSADSLNQAGLAPIKAVQSIDQAAFADHRSRSVNNLRQRAEKDQEIEAKVDDDVVASSVDEFFSNLVDIVNHILYGSKDGPEEPPVQQTINQAAGANESSLALNQGEQIHEARQSVTLYIADFDKNGSDLTNDFRRSPTSRFYRSRARRLPRSMAFFADVIA